MTRKKETEAAPPPTPPVARPVIAVEFDGKLYPSFQKAEYARAKSDLFPLLIPPRQPGCWSPHDGMYEAGQRAAVDLVLNNAERVHGILSRYMDAAKVEMPSKPD